MCTGEFAMCKLHPKDLDFVDLVEESSDFPVVPPW